MKYGNGIVGGRVKLPLEMEKGYIEKKGVGDKAKQW